jgi:glycosyltransferase involved in cell wall biosynthesis
MSGGDYHILKVAEHWAEKNRVLYLMPSYAVALHGNMLKGKVLTTNAIDEREETGIVGFMFLYFLRVVKVLASPPRDDFDVVLSSSHFLFDLIPTAYLHRRKPSSRFIAYCHGLQVKGSNPIMRGLRRINDVLALAVIRRYCDLVFAINPKVGEFLESRGVNSDKIVITENGIDRVREYQDAKNKSFHACYLGRLVKDKGVMDLVDIWKNVTKKIPDAKMAVIGDGPLRETLARAVRKERLEDRIVLFGFLSDERFEILNQSMTLVLPSRGESWSIAVLESMSQGVPVIAYDLPELRDVWGDDIIYARMGDTNQFSERVLGLLGDEEQYVRRAREGIRRTREFLWVNIANSELEQIGNAEHRKDAFSE